MTLLPIGLLSPFGETVSLGGYAYNILLVTLWNMIGGILLMLVSHYIVSKKKK